MTPSAALTARSANSRSRRPSAFRFVRWTANNIYKSATAARLVLVFVRLALKRTTGEKEPWRRALAVDDSGRPVDARRYVLLVPSHTGRLLRTVGKWGGAGEFNFPTASPSVPTAGTCPTR
jgi:hypothetical protein